MGKAKRKPRLIETAAASNAGRACKNVAVIHSISPKGDIEVVTALPWSKRDDSWELYRMLLGGRCTPAEGIFIHENGRLVTIPLKELSSVGIPKDVRPINRRIFVVEDALQHPQDFEVNETATEAIIAGWIQRGHSVQWCFKQPPILGGAIFEAPAAWTELAVKDMGQDEIEDAIKPLQGIDEGFCFAWGVTSHTIFVRDPSSVPLLAMALKLPVSI